MVSPSDRSLAWVAASIQAWRAARRPAGESSIDGSSAGSCSRPALVSQSIPTRAHAASHVGVPNSSVISDQIHVLPGGEGAMGGEGDDGGGEGTGGKGGGEGGGGVGASLGG